MPFLILSYYKEVLKLIINLIIYINLFKLFYLKSHYITIKLKIIKEALFSK